MTLEMGPCDVQAYSGVHYAGQACRSLLIADLNSLVMMVLDQELDGLISSPSCDTSSGAW